jgi:hypothetical protein
MSDKERSPQRQVLAALQSYPAKRTVRRILLFSALVLVLVYVWYSSRRSHAPKFGEATIIFEETRAKLEGYNEAVSFSFGEAGPTSKFGTKKQAAGGRTKQVDIWAIRQAQVVQAFRHSWQGYRDFAWGHDELHPLSKKGTNWFGIGLTSTAFDYNRTWPKTAARPLLMLCSSRSH